ncbi:NPP1 domain-containing protein [Colletotrichum scovillei]|uniref:NPP1 domain-containing protein n=1 Tax=Colletotrichum scovillei TaxID=1209932 RepID=UPI0015C3C77C|nr:NPP1 domain-containing protein [Colletotrichum scovillei]KAF4773840.1 NPP1 domain-containing protein [Colletotrichum scovillei]
MLGYEEAKERSLYLIVHTQVIQDDVKGFQDNFFKLCRAAKETVEATLKKNGMNSMEELFNKAMAELPKEEAEKYRKTIEELKPKGVLDMIKHPELRDALDAAIWLGDFMASMAAFAVNRAMAEEAALAFREAASGKLTTEAFAVLAKKFNEQTGNEISTVAERRMLEWDAEKLANFSAAEEKLALNGLSDAEKVAAETAAGARGMVRSGIYGLIAMGVIMAATWAYREYQEHQMAEKMKDGIQQLATGRLYAHQAKLTAQAYTSLPTIIEDIADAFDEHDTQELNKKLDKFVLKSRKLVPSEDLKASFDQLREGDKAQNQKLGDDPELEDIIRIHKEKAEALKQNK